MRAVLILSVFIAAAVACPLLTNKDCSCSLPKICPSEWNIKRFESQCATLAFQGTWYLQMTTPTYINGNNPLKTGLFCNSYPCTKNQLVFTDTTPCDDTDYNTEYEMKDISYNLYTQCSEIQKALLCPAYGKCSPYAIFSVGSEKYYNTPLIEKYPFIDKDLYRHKIVQGSCDRDYTIAVIGADDCWKEYMVFAVINQYDNVFCGDSHIIWVMTRSPNPDWCTYDKAYRDIKACKLSPNFLVSVDHSLESLSPSLSIPSLSSPSLTSPSLSSPSMSIPSMGSITTGDINGLVQKSSSVSTTSTKSINRSSSTSSSISKTTTMSSTVIIEKSTDFSSLYNIGLCDLYKPYKGLQILKDLDKDTIRSALCGTYFLTQSTPCSFFDTEKAKVGILNTCFPACGMQLCFDDTSIDDWDCNCPRMVMERGYDMRTGEMQMTRSYISAVYNDDHPFGSSMYALHTEGYYYDQTIDETDCLPLDDIICKPPSDIYKQQIIMSMMGYKKGEYLIFSVANRYPNPMFKNQQVPLVYCFTRDRIPSQSILNSITQEILRCGCNPNYLVKTDQSRFIETPYTFDRAFYESTTTSSSMTRSMVSSRGLSIVNKSPMCGLPSICPKDWDVKTFDTQYATVAFQGTWNLQMTTPTYINGNNPMRTGLFCNSYPCTKNQLIFTDTTPCDDTDYNIEYEMKDVSYNLYTQCSEIQKALLCPAYGKCSPYAIFSVGSEKYYNTPITEKYPFMDKDLYRHKIVQGSCDRDYTIAVIGADDCWEEYMVLAVMNEYDNCFSGNKHIIWVLTRDENPQWSTYQKACADIERSKLCSNYLVSVDHSIGSMPLPSMSIPSMSIPSMTSPSMPLPSMGPITTGDINGIVKKTSSVSTKSSSTRSINSDYSSSALTSSSQTTTMTSTVIIEKSKDYSSLYQYGQCDLYKNGIQILKDLDRQTIRNAFRGKYYLSQATPCSYFNSDISRVGMLNTGFPACRMQLCFDSTSIDDWDCYTPLMVMDRGYNMRKGEIQMTRSYITAAYPESHPFSSTVYSLYCEGYYKDSIEEIDCLPTDDMICSPPSAMYKHQTILSMIGYKENEYMILCVANRYHNPYFGTEPENHIIAYTRSRIPSQETMRCMNQELLQCGCNPNHLVKIDQTMDLEEGDYVFDRSYYESSTSCWESESSCMSSSTTTTSSSSSSSSFVSISCD